MGDLNKGVTFADGESVTAARLNNLVADATLKDNVVGEDQIQDGAVTGAKLSGSLSIAIGNLTVSEGAVIIGNATDDGSEATLNATHFEVVSTEIRLKDAGITNAKLAGSISADKLAGGITSLQLSALGTANSYGSATHVPRITTDVAGRVTGVSEVAILQAVSVTNMTIPSSEGGVTTGTLASTPTAIEISLRCASAELGYTTGDIVALQAMVGDDYRPALSVYVSGTGASVRRCSSSNPMLVMRADTGGFASADSTKWQVQLRWR